jgi:hypothetical protein
LSCDVAGYCEDAGGDGCLYYWGGHGCYGVLGYGMGLTEERGGIDVEIGGQHSRNVRLSSLAFVAAADWAKTS